MVEEIVRLLKELGVETTNEEVIAIIQAGGAALRSFAKEKTNNDPRCNVIPVF